MSNQPLRVLMISTDRNIFLEGSGAFLRMKEYAALVEELHIIIFANKNFNFKTVEIASNARAYPTDSRNRWWYVKDAYILAKRLFAPGRDKLHFSGIMKPEINLVTTQDPFETGLAGYFISRLLCRPLHLQVHTDFLDPAFCRNSFLNIFRVMIARFIFHTQADIRVVSERIKTSILERMKFAINHSPRITVLPVFVDAEKFIDTPVSFDLHKEIPGFELLILIVARLEKEKNVLLAVCLLEKLCYEEPSLRAGLVIVGTGSEEPMLRNYVKRAQIDDRVFFYGWQNDTVSFYKTADFLLVTSEYEGYGRMFVEAAASGCPVLTRDVGVAKEMSHSLNFVVCHLEDNECLYRNFKNLASDPIAREMFLASARGAVDRVKFQTKEEYLAEYKKMWEAAAKSDAFAPMI